MTKLLAVKHILVLACLLALGAGCNAVAAIEPATLDEAADEQLDLPPDDSSGSALDAACDPSSSLCNNQCVGRDDPAFGCGKATCAPCVVRHARAACNAGACVVAQCAAGFADCNGDPKDGCEADLSNAATCGACNVACSVAGGSGSAAALCAAERGCVGSCPSNAPTKCGSTCTDLRISATHCGACGTVCPGAGGCVNGACR